MHLPIVYMAHPLGDGAARSVNLARARIWYRWISTNFDVAVSADWVLLASLWEETPRNRQRGLAMDVAHIQRVDALWLVGGRVSAGMGIERDAARLAGKRVIDLTWLGEMPDDQSVPGVLKHCAEHGFHVALAS